MSDNTLQTGAVAPKRKPVFAARWIRMAQSVGWAILSIGLFVAFWEFAWWRGWANPLLLPPPHTFWPT